MDLIYMVLFQACYLDIVLKFLNFIANKVLEKEGQAFFPILNYLQYQRITGESAIVGASCGIDHVDEFMQQ